MNISKEFKRWKKFSSGFQKQPEEDSEAGPVSEAKTGIQVVQHGSPITQSNRASAENAGLQFKNQCL